MSALPPKADIRPRDQDVCFGPEADIRWRRARAVAYHATNATQIHTKKSCCGAGRSHKNSEAAGPIGKAPRLCLDQPALSEEGQVRHKLAGRQQRGF